VSLLTPPPSKEMQDFVHDIRYPKTGGAAGRPPAVAVPAS
jgi:hypothetical protein